MSIFERTALLIGDEAVEQLAKKHVAVFGVGGVGGYVVEALARSGIGTFTLVDNDVVSESNINRQIIATTKTIGRDKIEVMKERILDINPEAEVIMKKCFFLPENAHEFDFSTFDYVVDAIDTVTGKIEIVMQAKNANVPVICAMGAGNKLDPTKFVVTDLYKTNTCPLAKVMRREMKKRGVKKLKVVYSVEEAMTPKAVPGEENSRKKTPGSIAFVPSVAGLILASEVVKDMIGE